MAETRTMLAELPDPNKVVAFDGNRHMMVAMAENVDQAPVPQLEDLVQLLVERVLAKGRVVDPASIEWAPPARLRGRCVAMAPPDGPGGTRNKSPDPLAWYAACT